MSGLQILRYNGFSTTVPGTTYTQIAPPSFVVTNLSGTQPTAYQSVVQTYTATIGSGVLPAWCIPGAPVYINVTYNGMTYTWATVIKDIDTTAGHFFTFCNADNQTVINSTFSWALDAVAGSVVNSVTLCTVCQKAMLQVPAGSANVTISPVADFNGANPGYPTLLTAGGPEYELVQPTGSKFDITDWYAASATDTATLNIRME